MQSTQQSGEKIGDAIQRFDRRNVPKIRSRDRSIHVRVTAQESRDIKCRARRLDVSVSELLRQLFEHAKDRL